MNLLSSRLLNCWPDRWRFPALSAAVSHSRDLTIDAALVELTARWAAPADPADVWREVMDAGDYAAAEALLDDQGFLAAINSDEGGLAAELARERQTAYERVAVRCETATQRRLRLHGAGPPVEDRLREARRLVAVNSTRASMVLGDVEKDLAEAEGAYVDTLREQLRVQVLQWDGRDRSGWQESIERQLRAGEIEMAEGLLQARSAADVPTSTRFFTHPAVWPYNVPSHHVCRWFLEPESASFAFDPARWSPLSDDLDGWSLVRVLSELLPGPESATPDSVARFADALTRFLGGEPAPGPLQAESRDGFLWASLRSVSSPWLPALAARHGKDLPLAIPDFRVAEARAEAVADLVVVFDPWESTEPLPVGALRLSPEALFRAMPDRHARLPSVLFELGRQIPLERALPFVLPGVGQIGSHVRERDHLALLCFVRQSQQHTRPLSFQEVRAVTSTFLDVLGLPAGRPEELDRLAYYTVGDPELPVSFLRRMFDLLGQRRARRGVLDHHVIDEVWRDKNFRRGATDLLLSALRAAPLAHLTLQVLIYEVLSAMDRSGTDAVSLTRLMGSLGAFLELAEVPNPRVPVQAALDALDRLRAASYVLEVEAATLFTLGRGSAISLIVDDLLRAPVGIEEQIVKVAGSLR